jgi:hypothetical protein
MDVEILPVVGDPMKLTGERPEEGVSAGRLDHDRSQALIELVDAAAATTKDYGNERHAFTFSVSRVHSSAGNASLYYLTHASKVPPKGRIKFTCVDQDGTLVGVVYLEDATIVAKSSDWQTLETTFEYQIVGGAMTTGE